MSIDETVEARLGYMKGVIEGVQEDVKQLQVESKENHEVVQKTYLLCKELSLKKETNAERIGVLETNVEGIKNHIEKETSFTSGVIKTIKSALLVIVFAVTIQFGDIFKFFKSLLTGGGG